MRLLTLGVGGFRGVALYGDENRNPWLAVQRGPHGWLVLTRRTHWHSPRLRAWFEERR